MGSSDNKELDYSAGPLSFWLSVATVMQIQDEIAGA